MEYSVESSWEMVSRKAQTLARPFARYWSTSCILTVPDKHDKEKKWTHMNKHVDSGHNQPWLLCFPTLGSCLPHFRWTNLYRWAWTGWCSTCFIFTGLWSRSRLCLNESTLWYPCDTLVYLSFQLHIWTIWMFAGLRIAQSPCGCK